MILAFYYKIATIVYSASNTHVHEFSYNNVPHYIAPLFVKFTRPSLLQIMKLNTSLLSYESVVNKKVLNQIDPKEDFDQVIIIS